jgi:heme-degrading monooxygenase HmoA
MEVAMHARTGRLTVSPERIDEIVGVMKDDQARLFHGQQGYRGFTGLADRASGAVMGISFWETEDDLRAAEEKGREARRRVLESGGGQSEPVVERWEVLFDETV